MTRGGARANAGRKPGSGRYGCPTTAIRVPTLFLTHINVYIENLIAEKGLGLWDDQGNWAGIKGYEQKIGQKNDQ